MGLFRRVPRRRTLRYLRPATGRSRRRRSAAAEMVATAQLLTAIREWSREEPAPPNPDGPRVTCVHAELRALCPGPSTGE